MNEHIVEMMISASKMLMVHLSLRIKLSSDFKSLTVKFCSSRFNSTITLVNKMKSNVSIINRTTRNTCANTESIGTLVNSPTQKAIEVRIMATNVMFVKMRMFRSV